MFETKHFSVFPFHFTIQVFKNFGRKLIKWHVGKLMTDFYIHNPPKEKNTLEMSTPTKVLDNTK